MKFLKKCISSLNKFELLLWLISVFSILILSLLMPKKDYISIISTLFGISSLIFISKGNLLGPIISILFSFFYLIASLNNLYYGEVLICLTMNIPLSVISCWTWFKNRTNEKDVEVTVNHLKKREIVFSVILGICIMIVFYFILKRLDTDSLLISTISIFTSFVASYLSIRRSYLYAIFYSLNDIVLIILWTVATFKDLSNLCMVFCFIIFLINDIYGFINWKKLEKSQMNFDSY